MVDRTVFKFCRISILGAVIASTVVAHAGGRADEAPFLTANDAAMTKMMDGMAVKATGDVDTDFSAMMIPHHQGAIEMAEAVYYLMVHAEYMTGQSLMLDGGTNL